MARACANCGTEVDDDALFCPTCGQPIGRGGEPDLPPAPDWPSATSLSSGGTPASSPPVEHEAPDEADATRASSLGDLGAAAPGAAEPEPAAAGRLSAEPPVPAAATDVPPWRRGATYRSAAPPPPEAAAPIPPRPGALRPEGIIRPPGSLSGWLIGGGALVGVVGMLLPWYVGSFAYTGGWGLASGVNLLFTLVLLAVLLVVFLPHLLPELPQRNLTLLAISLVGVGIGLDRLALPVTGSGAMVFLIGMLVSSAGALLVQLGLDREVGGQLR